MIFFFFPELSSSKLWTRCLSCTAALIKSELKSCFFCTCSTFNRLISCALYLLWSPGYWRSCSTNLRAACSSSSPASSPPTSSPSRDNLNPPLFSTRLHRLATICVKSNNKLKPLSAPLSLYYLLISLFFSPVSLSISALL